MGGAPHRSDRVDGIEIRSMEWPILPDLPTNGLLTREAKYSPSSLGVMPERIAAVVGPNGIACRRPIHQLGWPGNGHLLEIDVLGP
jgi:hypothetical protein